MFKKRSAQGIGLLALMSTWAGMVWAGPRETVAPTVPGATASVAALTPHSITEQLAVIRAASPRNVLIVDCHGNYDYDTIQGAIGASADGDVIVVLPNTCTPEGVYFENINFLGKAIAVQSLIPTNPAVVAATIIDGNAAGTVVTFTSGEGPDSILDGLTIRNGAAQEGGGIRCVSASPSLHNCMISQNGAYTGGGMFALNGNPTLITLTFAANVVWGDGLDWRGGGGMYSENSNPTMVDCTFTGNLADDGDPFTNGKGGGLSSRNGDPMLVNCTFIGNRAGSSGGGVSFSSASSGAIFANCLFLRNSADFGGGMYTSGLHPLGAVTNCTFVHNCAETLGGGMYTDGHSPTLTNCLFWANTSGSTWEDCAQLCSYGEYPVVNYSCLQGWSGIVPGRGNIRGDPRFLNAAADDYRLQTHSPCIDAGTNGTLPRDTLDLNGNGDTEEPLPFDSDGRPRVGALHVDMGAFEFQPFDCNYNNVLDTIDIVGGTSFDCDGNGRPDECDTDCNMNNRPDDCDLTEGTSTDCNGNGTPDECDRDCNGNQVPDECDLLQGDSVDCNENGTPDECDVPALPDAKLSASDATQGDYFGISVSISGDVAVVGASNDDDGGDGSGSAYVFRYDGSGWRQEAKLTNPGGGVFEDFGWSVAISGDVIVIGVPGEDYANGRRGAAYVFRGAGSAWVLEAKLTAPDAGAYTLFGESVSVSGALIVVGAPFDDAACPFDPNCNSGAVYVFRHDSSGWVLDAKFSAVDTAPHDNFGSSVSISGDVVLASALFTGPLSGSAYVFRRDTFGWTQEAELVASDAQPNDYFGNSVSVSGDVAAVGAHFHSDAGWASGSGYIFRHGGSGWVEEAKLVASDAAPSAEFGTSVSISGDWAVFGASRNAPNGSAYVFRYDGATWVEHAKLEASDWGINRLFGESVAISGSVAMVGAGGDYDAGPYSGSAYVFRITGDCNSNGVLDECDIADGTSADCNLNQVPDECDLATGRSTDCNTNALPDECEPDFDGDGLIDACDPDIDNDGVPNAADLCEHTPLGAQVNDLGGPLGDFYNDCDVDLEDYQLIEVCLWLSGPNDPPPFQECLHVFDFDGDHHVDLADFAVFQEAFTGS